MGIMEKKMEATGSTWTPRLGEMVAPSTKKDQEGHHSTYFWCLGLRIGVQDLGSGFKLRARVSGLG